MSQEYVELVRTATEAAQNPEAVALLASGDFDFPLFDPEIEWDGSRAGDLFPDLADVYQGHEGVRTYWRRWLEAWRGLEFEVQDVLDAGDEIVVLVRNQRQWGRYTDIATELPPYAMVYTFRDGKIVRWRLFPEQDEALKAVGLEE